MHQYVSTNNHLVIYISTECATCKNSEPLITKIQGQFPTLTVEYINLLKDSAPSHIFAVPTYEYNGKIISLGNPSEEQLYTILSKSSEA